MSWLPFYDEPSTWSTAVSDACSAIVSYGVDIPWCVCNHSWTVMSAATEYLSLIWAAIYVALRLEDWWCTELTVLTFGALMNLPNWVRRSRGDVYVLASQVGVFLAGFAWLGCFLESAAGLQGGVVFGGKLFYPSLLLLALAVQGCRYTMLCFDKEVFGYGAVDAAARDNQVSRALAAFSAMVRAEGIFFLALAAFGFPKLEKDVDPTPWLCALPFLNMWKQVNDYFAANPLPQQDKERNGDVVQKEAKTTEEAKKPEAKKPEAAKKDDGKKEEEKKDGEETAVSTDVKKTNPLAGLINAVKNAVNAILGLFCAVHARVAALPWETITSLTLRLGTVFTWVWVFWTLTEDPVVLAAPLLTHVAPVLLDQAGGPARFGKDLDNLLRETAAVATAAVQYYIFKTNIVQY